MEATICWKTGQVQVVHTHRARTMGNRESHWTEKELGILRELWSCAAQQEIVAALTGRTWKSIAHQAYKQGWRRTPVSLNHVSQRRWQIDKEHEGRRLYEEGVPVPDVALKLGKTCSALLQRAWEKGWRRPNVAQKSGLTDACNTNQNPEVSKRITSGPVFGAGHFFQRPKRPFGGLTGCLMAGILSNKTIE